jgi:putative ABC transport system ATP-binding protein
MLKVNDLSVVFNEGTINEKRALNHLSFELNEGDFVTIIGSNGAGKSTLFQSISGAVDIKEGRIELDGKDITSDKEYVRSRVIGRLFQDPLKGTAPHMTIEENLALSYSRGKHFSLKPVSRKQRKIFVDALKQLDIGLEDRLTTKVGTLSGGQRQALTLLMATIVTPKLLLLDEHTAALDPATSQKVMNLSTKIAREHHITTMMITHNMEDALKYGNRTFIMNDGHIVLEIGEEQKKHMSVEDLVGEFLKVAHASDEMLLRK